MNTGKSHSDICTRPHTLPFGERQMSANVDPFQARGMHACGHGPSARARAGVEFVFEVGALCTL